MRKVIAAVLVVAGLAVVLYPHAAGMYRNYRMNKSLEAFAEFKENADRSEIATPERTPNPPAGRNAEEAEKEADPETLPLAVVKIDRIDLELPVFYGASDSILEQGGGLWKEGAGIGEEGVAVITAHRAYDGSQFNRLDELEVGDKIQVDTLEHSHTYRVTGSDIYRMTNYSYLSTKNGESRLVLYTCHPLYHPNPSYRLVVQAALSEK